MQDNCSEFPYVKNKKRQYNTGVMTSEENFYVIYFNWISWITSSEEKRN